MEGYTILSVDNSGTPNAVQTRDALYVTTELWNELTRTDLRIDVIHVNPTNADPTLTVFYEPQELDKPDGE